MKKKDIRELSTRTREELLKQLKEKKEDFSKNKLEVMSGKSKKTALLRSLRKDIARILMFVGQKEVKV